jgi:protein TonB
VAQPQGPVRIGGQLEAPALIHRVEPRYPPVAVQAQIQGFVVLEAVVAESGEVAEVRLLRSPGYGGVLDRAAIAALKQWRYSPLILNGHPTSFVLTVTLSFSIVDKE